MKKLIVIVCATLFVMGIGSASFAGMLDQAVDATEKANSMATSAKETADSTENKAIEAKDASTTESGSLVDQAKESAKETTNETIDGLGK